MDSTTKFRLLQRNKFTTTLHRFELQVNFLINKVYSFILQSILTMSDKPQKSFRGGIRLERIGAPSEVKSSPSPPPVEAPLQSSSSPPHPPPPVITAAQIEHNALKEELYDIQDEKLLIIFEFAQLVAGNLGISSEAEMKRIWTGITPNAMSIETRASSLGVSKEALSESLKEAISIIVNDSVRNALQDFVDENLEKRVRLREQQKQEVKTETSPIGKEQLIGAKEGYEPWIQDTEEKLYGESLLRQLLMKRTLSEGDIKAWKLLYDENTSKTDKHNALRTIWHSVSFSSAMSHFTPSAMAAIRQARDRVAEISSTNVSIEQLIFGKAVQSDFSILVSYFINKSIAERSGTYSGKNKPREMWSEINLLLKKFKSIVVSNGEIYISSLIPKNYRMNYINSDTEYRSAYKTLLGKPYSPPSMHARTLSRYVLNNNGTIVRQRGRPDYFSSALESL